MNINKLRSATILGLGVYFSCISPAMAQVRVFDMPADDAVRSIPQFGQQSGLQIIAPADKLSNVRTPVIAGQMDARVALNLLIKDTGLVVAHEAAGVITLKPSSFRREQPLKIDVRSGPSDQEVVQIAVQEQPAPAPAPEEDTSRVVIVGSQIAGADATGVVPVTVFGAEDIAALGAASGEDLFRSLPVAGDVTFNTQTLSGGSQGAARGDISSINLRGLGSSYTLLLLNGRRTVPYGLTQGRQESSYNANAIPTFGLERLEILRDGAAALYGADAVAGVVNNVLQTDFNGLKIQGQWGAAEGTNLTQMQLNVLAGTDFADGRGNITVFGNLSTDSALLMSDQDFTASSDKRSLVENTTFAGNTSFDTRGTGSGWGGFQVRGGPGTIRSNGAAVTNASGQFHIQPTINAGCLYQLGGGICIDDGVVTGAPDRNLRFDSAAAVPGITVTPGIDRINLFSTITYDLADGLEAYGEIGYYASRTDSVSLPVGPLASTPVTIAADNYYNPFGPITSPNRLPGLNIPDAGLPITISSYLLTDVGGRPIEVKGFQHRLLAGLKGDTWGWDWDSALLYSDSSAEDQSTNVQTSLWQQALARNTPDAYNPFNGGDPLNPALADATPSLDLSSYLIDARRYGKASLALIDFKVSRPDIFALPAGDVGMAAGVEMRWETSEDDRDATGDFSTPYTDIVTGITYDADTLGASAAWDVKGNRLVNSAFVEFAVPVVSPEMGIPLVHAVDVQLAGRYENYSDVGSVSKPKIAGSWDIIDGIRLRSSWQQGFIAPAIQQLAPVVRPTSQARLDDVLCEADLRAGRITSWGACSQRPQVQVLTAGNADLKPEESESLSFGGVIESSFLPEEFGSFTLTFDRWKIEQENKIGVLSAENALTLDYLMRVQGSSNPNVIRAPVTQSDIDFAAGTGLAPIGLIQSVITDYDNLDIRTIEGFDVGLSYTLPPLPVGDFTASVNYSELIDFFQSPSPIQQELLDAQSDGTINAGANIGGAASLLEDAGNPKVKWNASLVWKHDQIAAGLTGQYTGKVFQKAVLDPSGAPWEVEDQLSIGLWGEYTFAGEVGDDTVFRLGVRNLTDEPPPLATQGYLGNLYQPYGRYFYGRVTKTF